MFAIVSLFFSTGGQAVEVPSSRWPKRGEWGKVWEMTQVVGNVWRLVLAKEFASLMSFE